MYKIDKLLKLDQKTFHTADLAVIWNITNKNTLYTTIKRYVQKGILIPIQKGFYSTIDPKRLDPYALGVAFLDRFAYVSTETVLVRAGLISQKVYPITLVSDVSKRFSIGQIDYLCRKMATPRLFDSNGVILEDDALVALPKRAAADMLYFNPHYHFDKKP